MAWLSEEGSILPPAWLLTLPAAPPVDPGKSLIEHLTSKLCSEFMRRFLLFGFCFAFFFAHGYPKTVSCAILVRRLIADFFFLFRGLEAGVGQCHEWLLCSGICSSIYATPWTVAHQVPLSMGISRQEYWSGLPFHSPGYVPN